MKPFWTIAAISFAVAGCNLLDLLDGGGDGGAPSSSATGNPGPQGVDCGVDPDTSATLCLGNSLCPQLLVDTEVFPRCGFLVNGAVLDLECSCGGFLCPVIKTTACGDVQQALALSNEGIVCSQLGAGMCIQGTPVSTTTAGGGTCDQACRADCGGD